MKRLLITILIIFISSPSIASWDGRYNANFDFKMGAGSVCPRTLPIEIEIEVENNIVSGFIFNNGGGNKHKFCKLYHNGTISGKVDSSGKLIKVNIKQTDSHSREYSSYRITGELDNTLKLLSRSARYHPTAKFTFTKRKDQIITENTSLKDETPVTTTSTTEVQQSVATSSTSSQSAVTQPVTQVAEASSSSVGVVSEGGTTTFGASYTKWRNAQTPDQAQAYVNEIQASIVMYMAIYGVIEQQPPTLKDRVLSVVDSEITRLRAEKELLQQQLSQRFSTPIRPTNANLAVSAFRAADTFPKIPFYVPGTNEIGEMLVIPRVTDEGFLEYQFDFLDPTATYDKVRDSLSIPHGNVDDVILGLQKVDEWTKVAQDNNVNRRIEKTSACISVDACETKKQGISSSEIIFQVYEDGSTAGRIQRNKGLFSVGYNMSVESSILLSAYLTYMRDVGAKEFKIGIMTDEEVGKLFN